MQHPDTLFHMNHLTTPSDLYDHVVLSVMRFALSGFIGKEGLLDQSVLTINTVTTVDYALLVSKLCNSIYCHMTMYSYQSYLLMLCLCTT